MKSKHTIKYKVLTSQTTALFIKVSKAFCVASILLGCQKKTALVQDTIKTETKYPVTIEIEENIQSIQRKTIPDFALHYFKNPKQVEAKNLFQILQKTPAVVIAIKEGCPCNPKMQPIFNKLAKNFREKVEFIGIIDGDEACCKEYIHDTSTTFAIVSDKNHQLLKKLNLLRSGYTLLINQNKQIQKVWPGYSKGMFLELNTMLAKLINAPSIPFDPEYAPSKMTSGCAFEFDH